MEELRKGFVIGDFDFLLLHDKRGEYCEVYNCGNMEFNFNFHPSKKQAKEILRLFRLGIETGKKMGANEAKHKIRELLEVAPADISERVERLEYKI